MTKITTHQALIALDEMDDFARMNVGVDAKGPRALLERFIAENPQAEPAPSPDSAHGCGNAGGCQNCGSCSGGCH